MVLNWLVRISFWTLALLVKLRDRTLALLILCENNNVSMCIYFSHVIVLIKIKNIYCRIYLRQKVLMGQNVFKSWHMRMKFKGDLSFDKTRIL